MAYPLTADPKQQQMLDELVNVLEGITQTNGYHHDVLKVHVYEGHEIVLGSAMPSVVVVPLTAARRTQTVVCAEASYRWDLALVLNLRVIKGSDAWKREIAWLVSDVTKAIDDNIQLNGTAVYCEVLEDEVFDLGAMGQISQAEVTIGVEYRQAIGDPTQ